MQAHRLILCAFLSACAARPEAAHDMGQLSASDSLTISASSGTNVSIRPDSAQTTPFPIPNPVGFINDFAHVLPDSSTGRALAIIEQVRSRTKGEIAVVTVPSLNGYSAEEVSLAIARAWRVGYAGQPNDPRTNTGVLILLAPAERSVWIQLADGANAFISNDEATRISSDIMRPLFVKKDYGPGIVAGVSAIAAHFARRFNVTIETAS